MSEEKPREIAEGPKRPKGSPQPGDGPSAEELENVLKEAVKSLPKVPVDPKS